MLWTYGVDLCLFVWFCRESSFSSVRGGVDVSNSTPNTSIQMVYIIMPLFNCCLVCISMLLFVDIHACIILFYMYTVAVYCSTCDPLLVYYTMRHTCIYNTLHIHILL